MMNNASELYWELSQLIGLSNLTFYNVSSDGVVAGTVTLAVNCCTTEPNFSNYLESLPNDRAGLLAFLFLFSFATVFGNSLVILAVIRERYLHTATNYFVTSLAVADCLVGLVVMPFSALYEVLQNTWFFGTDWCDIWRSLDVLFSTASILNLCVISLDRYWAITDPFSYPMKMTRRKAVALIAAVWICSSAISFPAIVWWRAAREEAMPPFKCTFTEHLGYLVFSSTISFYLPLLVMVFTYCRIYRAAAIQTRSLKLGTKQVLMASGELQLTLRIHRGGTTRERPNHPRLLPPAAPEQQQQHHQQQQDQQQSSQQVLSAPQQQQQQQIAGSSSGGGSQQPQPSAQQQQHTANSTPEDPDDEPLSALQNNGLGGRHRPHMGKNFSLSRKLAKFAKEKKAAKTLGIVMGVFIVCWLPFFVVNLLSGFCMHCIAHEEIVSAVVTWLGWINSSMNPVIYACWSRDFRRAFVRILCVCCPRKIRRKYQPTMRSKASQRYLLWFVVPRVTGYQAPPSECHMAAIVASSSSVSNKPMGCSMFDNGYQRRNNRQQTLVGQHGRPGHHHHHQHYHHHRHYCNSHYYHHRSRPVAVSRGEARRGSLLSAADGGGARPSTPTTITTTSTSPTTTTTSMAGTFAAISNQQVPPSLVQPGSHSIAPPHQSSLPMTRRASSTGPTRRCTFAPSVNGGGGLRNGSRRLRRQSSSVASFSVDQERLPPRPVLPPPP